MFIRFLMIPVVALFAAVASAAPVQLLFPGSTFAPGTSFMFSVATPAATNLGSYQFDILLSGSSGTAGVDYFYDLGATDAAATGYVFPVTDFYADAANLDSPSTQRLTLSDFDFAGVDVVPGTNSSVATVVVSTLPSFTGDLSFIVDSTTLILDTPDITPASIAEFASIQADTFAAAPVTISISAVPEPTSFAMLTMTVAFSIARRRRRRRCAFENKVADR